MTEIISMAQAAQAYIQANGKRAAWAIFPLKPGRKKPDTEHGVSDATKDPAQVAAWWTAKPGANIGVACGQINGFIVLDVDKNHTPGVDGEETLKELEAKLGPLPETVEVLTPSGGRHLYFKYPAGEYDFRNYHDNENKTLPGIDIRANGGYVVAPPSKFNGCNYEWEVSSYPNECDMAELPEAWKQWLIGLCAKFTLPEAAPQGTRNDTLFKYGASLRAKGTAPEEIRAQLDQYNREHCAPPVEGQELDRIIKSVLKYPAGELQEPHTQSGEGGRSKPKLNLAALASELQARGYIVRYNVITAEYETTGRTEAGRVMSQDDLITVLHDALTNNYKGVTFDTLAQYVSYLARENEYNPVLELLRRTKWDGRDRIPELYALIGVENDTLSQKLILRWLYQTVALLYNDAADPFGADGCLVFNGPQGVGKTSLLRHLAMRDAWFGEGCSIDDRDKDTTRRVHTKWISEFGELESTLKSDISKLKAFVSAGVDRYRLPYGKADIVAARHTSLAATCNSERYLIDPTGNRRWWSVPITRTIKRTELEALDALQLWAQIFQQIDPLDYHAKAASFRLAEGEREQLAQRNGAYEKPLKGQIEVEDILAQAERDNLPVKEMTVSEFKAQWPALKNYAANQISAALKACKIELTRKKNGSVARLPFRGISSSWPE